MDKWFAPNPMRLFLERYWRCVVHVITESPKGEGSGTGFHVGDGIIITARHVVNEATKLRVFTRWRVDQEIVVNRVILPTQEDIDLAILCTEYQPFKHYRKSVIQARDYLVIPAPYIPIGSHLDDWMGDNDFLLSRVLIMGYPYIPYSRRPSLVTTTGEVHATVDRRDTRYVHFVVSPLPRGGFSGAPVISEYDFLLGVVTESWRLQDETLDSRFMALVSVEPLLELLAENGLYPPGFLPELAGTFRPL